MDIPSAEVENISQCFSVFSIDSDRGQSLVCRMTYSLQLPHPLEQVHHDCRICCTAASLAVGESENERPDGTITK